MRWCLTIEEYELKLLHVKGRKNAAVCVFSRIVIIDNINDCNNSENIANELKYDKEDNLREKIIPFKFKTFDKYQR